MKWKRFRDYNGGSLRDAIGQAETVEELEQVRRRIVDRIASGQLRGDTIRKLEKAGAARARYLETRLIVPPPRRIIIP